MSSLELTVVGRDADIDALKRIRADQTCVWGLPGIGKTAIVKRAFSAPIVATRGRSASDVMLEVKSSCSRSSTGGVVVDGVDTLSDEALHVLLGHLRQARVRAILTSRRRLPLPSAEHYLIEPLREEAAVELLRARLSARTTHPAWNGVDTGTLRELSVELGAVPGLLELLSKRASVLGPDEVRATIGAEDATLFDVDALLSALSERGGVVLEVLSLCPYGLTLSTLAAATETVERDVEKALVELSDRALLTFTESVPTHYKIMPPLRRVILGACAVERTGRVAVRVARAISERLVVADDTLPEVGNALAFLGARRSLDDVSRAALVDEVGRLCRRGHPVHVVKRAIDDALSEDASYAEPSERARLLLMRADVSLMAGALAEALGDLSEAQKLAHVLGDASLDERVVCVFARARHWEARFEAGLSALSACPTASARSQEDVRFCVAMLTYGLGDVERAITYAEQGLAFVHPDASNVGLFKGFVAMLKQDMGESSRARALYREALLAATRAKDAYLEAVLRNWIGLSFIDVGDLDAASFELARARESLEAMRDEHFLRAALGHLGIVAHFEGRLEESEALLSRAVAMAQRARDVYRACHFLAHLGFVRGRLGRRSEALLDFAAVEEGLARCEHPNPNLFAVLRTLRDGSIAVVRDEPRALCSSDVRIAQRLVVGRARQARAKLRAASDGRWFSVDGGEPVSLARRKPLARLLAAFATRARSSAETGLTSEELIVIGWPSERAHRSSAIHRVHVAISELRRMGLTMLVSGRSGYRLDADVDVEPLAD